MKPSKNRVYCPECGRTKMLFESKKKAELFMKFNNEEIEQLENGKIPVRAYECKMCGGWHLTSKEQSERKRTSIGERIDANLDVLREVEKLFNEFEKGWNSYGHNRALNIASEFRSKLNELRDRGLNGVKLIMSLGYRLTNLEKKIKIAKRDIRSKEAEAIFKKLDKAMLERDMVECETHIVKLKQTFHQLKKNDFDEDKLAEYCTRLQACEDELGVNYEYLDTEHCMRIDGELLNMERSYKSGDYKECEGYVTSIIAMLQEVSHTGSSGDKARGYYRRLESYCSNLKLKIDSNIGEMLPEENAKSVCAYVASVQAFNQEVERKKNIMLEQIDAIYTSFAQGDYMSCETKLIALKMDVGNLKKTERKALDECITVVNRYEQLISPYFS